MNYFFKYKYYILGAVGIFILLIVSMFLKGPQEEFKENASNINLSLKASDSESSSSDESLFYVDVKGSVNNPGVYEFTDGSIVLDAITTSGGLTRNGTTSNINLSKKLQSEMVIYIYSKNELKTGSTTSNSSPCECETIVIGDCTDIDNQNNHQNNNSKVNINTAGISELTTLSGIGESKAKAIIEYRKTNGNFSKIEDLTNVSGIGSSTFEKIKDLITV